MRRTLRVTTAAASVVGITVAATALASPARADVNQCQTGNFCFWKDGGFNGVFWPTNFAGVSAIENGVGNQASSWKNARNDFYMCVYDADGYDYNPLDVLAPNTQRSTIPAGTNDRADTVKADYTSACDTQ